MSTATSSEQPTPPVQSGSHPTRTVHGVCNLCEAICGLLLTVEDRPRTEGGPHVTGVRGNPDDPLSRGHICPKGVALPDIHADPDRLRRPVKRVGEGDDATWVEIDWDEALDIAADAIASTVNAHGDDALALYLGNPNVHSLGAMTHGTAFAGSFRTRNKHSATSVDQLPLQLACYLMYGHQFLIPVPDIDRTSFFLVFGGNPMASNGSLMTVPDFPGRLRELKASGGRMVVLDPRRTETAKVADEHHFVRPGTDAWVLLAMLHTLFAEGLATPPAWVDGVGEVREAVESWTPELAEQVSRVPAADIRRLTRDLASADGGAAYGRLGISTQEFGLVCQWAVQCLNVLTGNLDSPGGTMLTKPLVDVVDWGLLHRGGFARRRSRVRELPEFGGELPVSALAEEIETPGKGQVRALITSAGNPVLSTPDGARLAEAIEGLDHLVAVDIYLNETTRHADVVLPPTTALERDHYDLVFQALAVRDTARFTPAVLPKPDDARHDWEIFRDLFARVQQRLDRPMPRRRRLATRARLALSPAFSIATLLRLKRASVLMSDLRKNPAGVDLGPLKPQLPERLATKDRRVRLAPAPVMDDLSRLRAVSDEREAAGEDHGLVLIGRRHQRDNNSWMHNQERLTRGRPRHQLFVHPEDLVARDLEDGQRVRVTSAVGAVEVEVRATDEVMRGVVSLPHGYGHARHGTPQQRAAGVPGVSINDLTDPARLDVASGNAVLSGVPVEVVAASPA
ncbi:molybdopterin-dependent oxidoreductase [Nocardioidaceae bacterium]|nr:molybdopterin-dependent oxidoreductase [Nocardioidaceae bacterium]